MDERRPLLTTNFVRAEALTYVLRHRRLGHHAAVQLGRWLADSAITILPMTPDVETRAWEIFVRHDRSGFTYTDCTSFAAMELRGLSTAFAFDEHFAQMGFERLAG